MKKSNKELQMCVCALGSRDNSVSVWLTGFLRPIVVMENLFSGPVLDLTWSTVGHHLLACSFDGTVALLKFSESEIGKTITKQEKVSFYEVSFLLAIPRGLVTNVTQVILTVDVSLKFVQSFLIQLVSLLVYSLKK